VQKTGTNLLKYKHNSMLKLKTIIFVFLLCLSMQFANTDTFAQSQNLSAKSVESGSFGSEIFFGYTDKFDSVVVSYGLKPQLESKTQPFAMTFDGAKTNLVALKSLSKYYYQAVGLKSGVVIESSTVSTFYTTGVSVKVGVVDQAGRKYFGANVKAACVSVSDTTDRNGFVTFYNMPSGPCNIIVDSNSQYSSEVDVPEYAISQDPRYIMTKELVIQAKINRKSSGFVLTKLIVANIMCFGLLLGGFVYTRRQQIFAHPQPLPTAYVPLAPSPEPEPIVPIVATPSVQEPTPVRQKPQRFEDNSLLQLTNTSQNPDILPEDRPGKI
jgi:hypothetical protein